MIIGINGYIGSGKDTVGKLIQDISEESPFTGSRVWEIKKFAGKLKQIASILTGISVDKFEDQNFKKLFLGPEWDKPSEYRDRRPAKSMTVREFLQKLGTEGLRDGLHQDVWVNALFADYTDDKNWIVTDTRFPNEAQAIKERGGIVIRVNRPAPPEELLLWGNAPRHPSETSLDTWQFDHIIDNSSTLEYLKEEVEEMLSKFKLI